MRRKRAARGHPGILETFVDPLFGAFGAFLFIFLMVMLIIGVVGVPPEIATERLPPATDGVGYEVWLSGRGGVGQYAWRLAPGSRLPEGLELDLHGHLSGVPRLDGAASGERHAFSVELEALQVKAESPEDALVRRHFELELRRDRPIQYSELPPVHITSEDPLPEATVGKPYRLALAAVGGLAPYAWTLEGSVPAGLRLDPGSGLLTGRPRRAAERLELAFRVADARPPGYAGTRDEKTVSLAIAEPPPPPRPEPPPPPELELLSKKLPPATAGTPYRAALAVRGGAPPLSFQGEALPTGLALGEEGVLEGTPEEAGRAELRVTVEDSRTPPRRLAAKLPLIVLPPLPPLEIATPEELPPAGEGRPYSLALAAVGGDGSYRWSAANGLPPGLELAGGQLAGRPAGAADGHHRFRVRVESAEDLTAEKELVLAVRRERGAPPLRSAKWLALIVLYTAYSLASRSWKGFVLKDVKGMKG